MKIISDDKLQASLDENSIIWTGSTCVTICPWPLPKGLHDLTAFADRVRERTERVVAVSAATCVLADINLPWNGFVDVDLESAAMTGSSIERFQKHRLASLGLEVLRVKILDTLVQLVKAPHLRLLAQKANDGAERHGEEAEEDVDELLVRLCK